MHLDTSISAALGKLLQVLCTPSLAQPTTYLLDEHIPFVQAQLVPQLLQHLVNRFVRASFALVRSEWHDDIYTEVLTLEQPGQLGRAHNCCKEGKKSEQGKLSPSKQKAGISFP